MRKSLPENLYINEDLSDGVVYKKKLLLKKIIKTLYTQGDKTISYLCDVTKNSVPTVSNVIEDLLREDWIKNFGIGESKGGRKPVLYGLNPDAGFVMGVDLSRRYTRMGIFNIRNTQYGEILEKDIGLENTDDVLSFLQNSVKELLKVNKVDHSKILGMGIAIPGLFDIRKGISHSYPQLGENQLQDTLEELLGFPVFVEHDTRSMALGERWFGKAKDYSNVLFLNIGSGIGLSMILDGKLYKGHTGYAGEFGHIQIDKEGELCYCGKIGCLETVASGTAIAKRAQREIKEGKNSIIIKQVDGDLSKIRFRTVIKTAKMGDQYAIELMEDMGEQLSKGIATLIHLFNPEAILLGGEIAEAVSLIQDPIRQKLNKYTMLILKEDAEIIVSDLKNSAGLLGTIPFAISNLLFPGV